MGYYGKQFGATYFDYGIGLYLIALFKFIVTLLISVLSYYFFENRVLGLKSRFTYKF